MRRLLVYTVTLLGLMVSAARSGISLARRAEHDGFVRPNTGRKGMLAVLSFVALLLSAQAEAAIIVTNTNDSGAGSLRQAIINANATPGADDIVFNIPTSDPGFVAHVGTSDTVPCSVAPPGSPCWWRIGLLSPLPTLTDSGTRIRGSTQTAFVGGGDTNPGVVGTGGTVGVDACPLPFYERPEIAIDGNGLVSVALNIDGAASNILIEGMAVYNVGILPSDDGDIAIRSAGSSSTIGSNRVIGTTPSEPTSRPMFVGVLPDGSDPLVLTPPKRNLGFGVRVFDPYQLTVTENFIGHNGRGGIDGAANLSVLIATKNEVFDNGGLSDGHDGIDVNGINGLVDCNLSRDNTNNQGVIPGTLPRGGAGNGIEVGSRSASVAAQISNNVITNNTVSGNLSAGISIRKGATGNVVEKNVIFDNEIGISVDQETRSPTNRNLLSKNSIFMNMSIGIDLQHETHNLNPTFALGDTDWYGSATPPNNHMTNQGPDGVTPNNACDADATEPGPPNPAGSPGSNNLQNWPTLTAVITDGSMTLISGTLNSTANTQFTLEFFATPDGVTFGSGDREGQTFIGSTTVTTDGTCNASFTVTFSVGLTDDDVVTATATDPATGTLGVANTSEFSNSVPVAPSGQKVTGGGTYYSPAGAYTDDPDIEGRASFGFNIKLKDLNPVPQGVTNFRFRPANLHFISTSYEAGSFHVVDDMVSGKNADWRGTGKLNGAPGRCFQVNVHDDGQGAEPQGTEQDKFRIKIWQPTTPGDCSATAEASATVIYDNDSSASLAGQAGTLLDGGNIEVH